MPFPSTCITHTFFWSHGRRAESPVREAIRRHDADRLCSGYRRSLLLRREGIMDNHKRVHRLYGDMGAASPAAPAASPPGLIESFNGELRDECLNEHEFITLNHAREVVEAFREDYNQLRPHSSLNNLTPASFAVKILPDPLMGPREGAIPPPATPNPNPQPQPNTPELSN